MLNFKAQNSNRKKYLLVIPILFVGGILLLVPVFAHAGLVPCSPYWDPATKTFVDKCTFCDLFQLFENAFNFITWTLAAPLAVVLFVIGGLMLMFGGASTTSRTRALSIVRGTLIGLLVILLSWVIVKTTINIVTGSLSDQPTGFPWPWHNIDPKICS